MPQANSSFMSHLQLVLDAIRKRLLSEVANFRIGSASDLAFFSF